MRKWMVLFPVLALCGLAQAGGSRGVYPVFGRSVQIDPHFGRYFQDRSPASSASEIRVNGYQVVRYIVTADSLINGALIDAFHREGIGVWYATFGNGTYSRKDLPAGWEAWRMVTRSDLAGQPLQDGYTRLCLNHPGYRAWKKSRIAETLKAFPFDGVDIMEPHWPEYPGPVSPAFACFCETCRTSFKKQFPHHDDLPDIMAADSPRSPARNPALWRDWLAFRQASLTVFLNDLVNGPGGIREVAPQVKVCTWTLALRGPDGVQRIRDDSGEDAGEIARVVKPDLHCLQTHWPDWLVPDLLADYVKGYRPFVDQIRAAVPTQRLLFQADIGSKPENRRSWTWIRDFERTSEELGVTSTTFYEYTIGDYTYTDPPRIADTRVSPEGVELYFNRRLDAASARDVSRYAISPGRVIGARVDGNIVTLALADVRPGAACKLTVRDLRDCPELRLFKDRPPAVLESQTVEFRAYAPAAGPIIQAHEVIALQREPEDPATGRYDWGPSVMYDGTHYRMWWTRLGGSNRKRFPYAATLPDGERFEFTYPDRGDRIYYAESRDGVSWQLSGPDYSGPREEFGPDASGPLMVFGPAESERERMHIGCPSVIRVDGTYYLYYEAACEFKLFRSPDGQIRVGDEYHNGVFVATSQDGRTWRRHPEDARPQPIVVPPEANKQHGRQRYGLGQPSVFYRGGKFVMHYVDSCTGPGDFQVRLEADNPYFRNPRIFPKTPGAKAPAGLPAGSVARFAQVDVKYLDDVCYLLRPAYGTGRLGLLGTRSGVFDADAAARLPQEVYPQIDVPDPRGGEYRERLFPRFLTDPHGRILVQDGYVTIYYAAGRGFKEAAYTWDLHRARVAVRDLTICVSAPAP
ncbi:MAG TPA: hypothetical protein PKG54_12785 [Phycisphaerae bacterium]|jgi:hypothetical protein|nr:hypothetical protein [Phycisphaerae bacterium]HOB75387.1 hypothetical protein [Phycisphaerae bacterium]HOJ55941.1 hypothetical protein [Phycisphaerae bacterium]HOL26695.1 hypothetical protein [Phycisphaerae bacterium]HPP20556.1 hypothetical protein [Phycisphaerae bacterium]